MKRTIWRLSIMFVKTDSGIRINLDHIVLVEINQQFMLPRADGYELKAITTNIQESDRQSHNLREANVSPKPAEILPYSVQITEGTIEDCKKVFDKIAERNNNFIKFTENDSPRLLNLKHVISFDRKQSSNGQNESLEIILNTFYSDPSTFGHGYSDCHFPTLLPYKISFSDYHGQECKEIIETIGGLEIL